MKSLFLMSAGRSLSLVLLQVSFHGHSWGHMTVGFSLHVSLWGLPYNVKHPEAPVRVLHKQHWSFPPQLYTLLFLTFPEMYYWWVTVVYTLVSLFILTWCLNNTTVVTPLTLQTTVVLSRFAPSFSPPTRMLIFQNHLFLPSLTKASFFLWRNKVLLLLLLL